MFNWMSCETGKLCVMAGCWVGETNGVFKRSIMSPGRLERSLF